MRKNSLEEVTVGTLKPMQCYHYTALFLMMDKFKSKQNGGPYHTCWKGMNFLKENNNIVKPWNGLIIVLIQ